ncbi:MAG: hypothetical protein L6Q53_07785, partial [Candidatus Brocadia sinica]|nr:hypothetical protein [Candidatus Brocadia sinica]
KSASSIELSLFASRAVYIKRTTVLSFFLWSAFNKSATHNECTLVTQYTLDYYKSPAIRV